MEREQTMAQSRLRGDSIKQNSRSGGIKIEGVCVALLYMTL